MSRLHYPNPALCLTSMPDWFREYSIKVRMMPFCFKFVFWSITEFLLSLAWFTISDTDFGKAPILYFFVDMRAGSSLPINHEQRLLLFALFHHGKCSHSSSQNIHPHHQHAEATHCFSLWLWFFLIPCPSLAIILCNLGVLRPPPPCSAKSLGGVRHREHVHPGRQHRRPRVVPVAAWRPWHGGPGGVSSEPEDRQFKLTLLFKTVFFCSIFFCKFSRSKVSKTFKNNAGPKGEISFTFSLAAKK